MWLFSMMTLTMQNVTLMTEGDTLAYKNIQIREDNKRLFEFAGKTIKQFVWFMHQVRRNKNPKTRTWSLYRLFIYGMHFRGQRLIYARIEPDIE